MHSDALSLKSYTLHQKEGDRRMQLKRNTCITHVNHRSMYYTFATPTIKFLNINKEIIFYMWANKNLVYIFNSIFSINFKLQK